MKTKIIDIVRQMLPSAVSKNEQVVDTWVEQILTEFAESQRVDVSDEEIMKESKKVIDLTKQMIFRKGAKWMRSKLSKESVKETEEDNGRNH